MNSDKMNICCSAVPASETSVSAVAKCTIAERRRWAAVNKAFLVVILSCLLPIAAKAAASFDEFAAGPVIARGKSVEVRRGMLDDAFVAYRANLTARGQTIPEARRESAEAQLLDRIIVTQLLVQKATAEDRARAATNSARFIEDTRKNAESEEAFLRHLKSLGLTYAQFTNRVVDQAVSEEVVTREVRSQIVVSDEAIRIFYQTNTQVFKEPELARLSHIFVATRELGGLPMSTEQKQARKDKAQKLLARARMGENFSDLTLQSSDDPMVKENKGEYKLARGKDDPRRAMVPEFEKAAFALKPGEISDIVTTEFGYHIIKMHEIVPARVQPLEEVRNRIRDHLLQAELEKRMTPYFAKLKKDAAVEILDERMKTALEKLAAEEQKTVRP